MRSLRGRLSRLTLLVSLIGLSRSAVWAHDSARFDALVGLARSERAAGRPAHALDLFRQADQLQRLDVKLLAEFFWTAAETDPRATEEIGRRLLTNEPAQDKVRDKLVAIALQSHDEERAVQLAEEGARLSPGLSLWPRRLGESRLRQRQPAAAADAFARAAALADGTRADAAQAALSFEVAGSIEPAYDAWRRIEKGVWGSRAAWAASRMRTIAAIEPPLSGAKTVTEYLGRFPADKEARSLLVELYAKADRPALALKALGPLLMGPSRARWLRRESALARESGDVDRAIRALEELSRAGLATESDDLKRAQLFAATGDEERLEGALRSLQRKAGECSTSSLEVLDKLTDPTRLIQAVQARGPECGDQRFWLDRAVAGAVAAGQHEQALSMLERLLAGGRGSIEQRDLYGLVLLWTGQTGRAIVALEDVLSAAPERTTAVEALVEALRADGRPDEAWAWVERLLSRGRPDRATRVAWAQLALEAHHATDALRLVEIEPSGADEDRSVRSIRGQALVQLGRFEEARAVLEAIAAETPRPEEVLALLDTVEATSGISEAIRVGARWDSAERAWMEVAARLAVLEARNGHDGAARQRTDRVARLDARRGLMLEAEIELASRSPQRARDILRGLIRERPSDTRVADLYATALAESGDLEGALALMAELRVKRPGDVAWQVREADWWLRRSPNQERLAALERLAADDPRRPDIRLALAGAYARDSRWDAVLTVLKIDGGPAAALSDPELELAVTGLAAFGRLDEALALLGDRESGSRALALRRADLVARRDGATAATPLFSELAARNDADAAVYLAWAHASGSGPGTEQILADGASRFPDDALLHEELAVERRAAGNVRGAKDAALRALALNVSLVRASIVAVESLQPSASDATVLAELDRFEARFGANPAAMLELADRLGGSLRADNPIARRMIEWVDRIRADKSLARRAALTKARLFAAIGSWKDALDSMTTVLQASPTMPEALKLRAALLSYAGDYAGSIAAYDAYLAVTPGDVEARRQQARVEGWRQAYGAARTRYQAIARLFPNDRAIRAEAEAKTAFYNGQWRRAIVAYRDWLSLEPDDLEARFELAQAYEQAGEYLQARNGYMSLLAEGPRHRQATEAYARMRERRATSASFSAETESYNGYGGQQLLNRADSLARLSGGVGAGSWSLMGGPSRVADSTHFDTGLRVNAGIMAIASPSWRVDAGLGAHEYSKMGSMYAGGDISLSWLPTDRLRLQGGIERTALQDNLHTVEQGIAAAGPRIALSYRPTSEFSFDLSASEGWLTDRNRRVDERFSATHRLLRGRHELSLLGDVEDLQYREGRTGYFSPADFWKEHLGFAYRGWFQSPKFSGDRGQWIEGTYLAGIDNRQVIYHSGSLGITYEFASGVSLNGSGTVTRSAVYNSSGFTFTVRLRPFSSAK
jgi:predicted Zn-dependent protease